MQIFTTTLNQMLVMFTFIALGFILNRKKLLPVNAAGVLSKLETYAFLPCLTFTTFYKYFTYENIKTKWVIIVAGFGVLCIAFALSFVLTKIFGQKGYMACIYRYSFTCANFGFMGNAVVLGVFGESVLFDYMMFTIPFNMFVYSYAVQTLKPNYDGKGINLKGFINPIFISIILGAVFGLLNLKLPTFLLKTISESGSCMSPIAMLLTGFVIGAYSLKKLISAKIIYVASFIRLILLPLFFVIALRLLSVNEDIVLLALCATAMPLGLNTVVFPAAYGGDTTTGASMALISHALSVITVPIMFGILL